MCFAAPMDLAAGVVITGIGVDAVRRAEPRQRPLAALPILFGVHQLLETLVWWDLQGRVCHAAGSVAEWLYLLIALVVVPVAVPFALARDHAVRPPLLARAFVAGGVVAAVLNGLPFLRDGDPPTRIDGHHIVYSPHTLTGTTSFLLYVLVTCGPGILARSPRLRLFGVLNLAAVAVVVWAARDGTVSLWCFWAALTSVVINLHVRRASTPDRRSAPEARATS